MKCGGSVEGFMRRFGFRVRVRVRNIRGRSVNGKTRGEGGEAR